MQFFLYREAEVRRHEAEERERRQVTFDTEMPDRYAGMQLEDPPMIIRIGTKHPVDCSSDCNPNNAF